MNISVNDNISEQLIAAFTGYQEAYKLAVHEFALYAVKTEQDVDVVVRLAEDARILFDRYLQAHTDAKMYSSPLRVV